MACAKSPARAAGVICVAKALIAGFAAGSGASTWNSLAVTRSMFPSTGVACRPNAIAAIAAAV